MGDRRKDWKSLMDGKAEGVKTWEVSNSWKNRHRKRKTRGKVAVVIGGMEKAKGVK